MPGSPSSEPERVDQITSDLFAGQSGARWSTPESRVTLLGGADRRDDAAWFGFEGSGDLVFGSDYVRGSEFLLFQLGVLNHYDIGYYLAAANLSDIAAMGAQPMALTSVIRYPKELSDNDFHAIARGIRDCCAEYGCLNVGGDIGTAERIILSASAIGLAPTGRTITRSGAKPGDAVVLSAPTGIALAAMIYFDGKQRFGWQLSQEDEARLVRAWKHVEPAIALGRILSEHGLAHCCQDTSDGLRATIEQIERASDVSINIDFDAVPVDTAVARVAKIAGLDPLEVVFGGSVDFRLLFTVAPSDVSALPPSVHVIGRVAAAHEPVQVRPGTAWSHQVDPLTGYRRVHTRSDR